MIVLIIRFYGRSTPINFAPTDARWNIGSTHHRGADSIQDPQLIEMVNYYQLDTNEMILVIFADGGRKSIIDGTTRRAIKER